jgi:hypothetical protein
VPIGIATALATRDNNANYIKIDSWFASKSKVEPEVSLIVGEILSHRTLPQCLNYFVNTLKLQISINGFIGR